MSFSEKWGIFRRFLKMGLADARWGLAEKWHQLRHPSYRKPLGSFLTLEGGFWGFWAKKGSKKGVKKGSKKGYFWGFSTDHSFLGFANFEYTSTGREKTPPGMPFDRKIVQIAPLDPYIRKTRGLFSRFLQRLPAHCRGRAVWA